MDAVDEGDEVAVRKWWALSVLCLSLVVVSIHSSILNVALPTLVRELGATDSQLQWIVDADIVAFAGMLLTGAALADRFGRREIMVLGLVLVGVTSVAAGLSTTPTELIVWRAGQGASSALVMPATLSILVNVFTDRRQRSTAIAIWSLMNATGSFVGPISGGLLLRYSTWNSCFFVVVPFIVIGIVMAYVFVPTSRDPRAVNFDIAGAALSTVALGALVWALIEAPSKGWGSPAIAGAFAVAVIAAVLFIRWELTTDSPMIDLSMFANRQLSGAVVSMTIAFLAMNGSMYLASLTMQLVKGYSPLRAAVSTSGPVTLLNLLVIPAAPMLIRRFGPRVLVTTGTLLIATAALIIARVSQTSPYWTLGLGFGVMAVAFGISAPAATEAVMTAVPAQRSGGASAANQLARQVGQALGIAIAGGIATIGFHSHFHPAASALDPAEQHKATGSLAGALSVARDLTGTAKSVFLSAARDSYISGVRMSLTVLCGLALLGAIFAGLTIPSRLRHHDSEPDDVVTPAPLLVESEVIAAESAPA